MNGRRAVAATRMNVDFLHFIGDVPFSEDRAYPYPAKMICRIFGTFIGIGSVINLSVFSVPRSVVNNREHSLPARSAGMRRI